MGSSSRGNLSQKLKNQIPGYLSYGFFVFILFLLVSPIIYRKSGIGLDQSWQMALNMVRAEVTSAFNLHQTNYNKSGFKISIPKSQLSTGTYKVSLVIEGKQALTEIPLNNKTIEIK